MNVKKIFNFPVGKTKLIGLLTIFLIGVLAVCGVASAAIEVIDVDIDGSDYDLGDIIQLDLGEEFEVKVTVENTDNFTEEDIQIEVYIRGYDHDDLVEDITNVFKVNGGRKVTKKLTLKVPQRLDRDDYKLFIRVENRDGQLAEDYFVLDFNTPVDKTHDLAIKDVVFSPEGSVKAGRALLASVRLKNYGEKDEEGIKVKVIVPDLGISASDYIDELESDESTTSEEIYLRIPSCSAEGTYDVRVEVTYDDGDEKIIEMSEIRVISDETCEVGGVSDSDEKPTITYDSSAQDVTTAGAIYTLTMSNPTNSARTVTIGVNGVDVFGSVRVSPSNVIVLGAGETKTVYLYITADKSAKAGQYSFSVTVSGLGTTAQEISLTANVIESAGLGSVKKALEVGLVVLVAILVVLGLIIGFRKLKSEEEIEEDKTYY